MKHITSPRERELFAEYVRSGHGEARARHMAKSRYMSEVIRTLKVTDPVRYAALLQHIQNAKVECEFEAERREQLAQRLSARTQSAASRARVALMDTVVPLPPLDRSDYIAFREWAIDDYGCLRGTGAGSDYRWREFNVASAVPKERNSVGLYAVRIDAQSMVTGGIGCHFHNKAAGLVALSGDVVEHDDVVLRAECARILCIWYMPHVVAEAYGELPVLLAVYPTTPVYVTTKQLAAEALFRVAVALIGTRHHESDFVQDFGMREQF